MSFPLYAVHVPLLFFAEIALKKAGYPGVAVFFMGQLALAFVLGRYIDPPLRKVMMSAIYRPAKEPMLTAR